MNTKSKTFLAGRNQPGWSVINQPGWSVINQQAARLASAFSLVEILVVVAILALLVGLLLPSISRMKDQAKIASSQANINLIAAGVDMYEQDFNDLPPSIGGSGKIPSGWKGAEIICLLMTGYADDSFPSGGSKGTPFDDGDFSDDDGKAGFGFRAEKRGRVYGPYNGTEKIAVTDGPNGKVFIDAFDNPILYYKYDGSEYVEAHNDGVYPDPPNYPEQTNYLNPLRDHQGTRKYLLLTAGIDKKWGVDDAQHFPGTGGYKWSDFDDLGNFEKK